MKTTTCPKKFTLRTSLLATLSAGLAVGSLALAAQEVDPTAQLPKKSLVLKRDAKSTATPISSEKKTNISGNGVGPIGDIIDGGGAGPGVSMDNVSVTALSSISPLGYSTTVTPDTALPLSAWKKVECNITTSYFPTITGAQPNDDVIKTSPTLSISNNAISYVCPYKTPAHLLNIAKSVAVWTDVSISHSKNGMSYTYSGALLQSCTRATKTTVNWTCGI